MQILTSTGTGGKRPRCTYSPVYCQPESYMTFNISNLTVENNAPDGAGPARAALFHAPTAAQPVMARINSGSAVISRANQLVYGTEGHPLGLASFPCIYSHLYNL